MNSLRFPCASSFVSELTNTWIVSFSCIRVQFNFFSCFSKSQTGVKTELLDRKQMDASPFQMTESRILSKTHLTDCSSSNLLT